MTSTPEVRAAGCVVARSGEPRRYLLVHRPRYDDWSLAKGKVDPGETEPVTALRELVEETGLVGSLGPELSPVHYVDHKGRPKVVRYWLVTDPDGEFVANDEVDVVEWLGIDDAMARCSYAHDAELLAQAEDHLCS